MSEQVMFQPAYLLHHRAVGERDAVFTLFTQYYGKIDVWVKGSSSEFGVIPSFKPLLVSWRSKGNHKILTEIEIDRNYPLLCSTSLVSNYLYSALYINELNYRFLPELASSEVLYGHYIWLLESMAKQVFIEPVLRIYELYLLLETGLVSDIFSDIITGQSVVPDKYYRYLQHPEFGFGVSEAEDIFNEKYPSMCFSGLSLIKFQKHNLDDETSMLDVKRLMRVMIHSALNGKSLKSRDLFINFKRDA